MDNPRWDEIDEYFTQNLVPPDEALEHALETSTAAGLPQINVTPTQGRFLNLLVRTLGAKRILEIGTLGGYSTIWLARALPPDGSLITLELDPECAAVARANFEHAGLADRIDLREGLALETLSQMEAEKRPPFDFVFLDADKEHHPEYFQWALAHSRPGTVIVADNVVRGGAILDSAAVSEDPHLQGIRRLVELMGREPRVDATALQTVGSKGYDGFVMALVIA